MEYKADYLAETEFDKSTLSLPNGALSDVFWELRHENGKAVAVKQKIRLSEKFFVKILHIHVCSFHLCGLILCYNSEFKSITSKKR